MDHGVLKCGPTALDLVQRDGALHHRRHVRLGTTAREMQRRQWNTQGKGTVLATMAVEHTRQRHRLSHDGSRTHKAKAPS